MVNKPFKICFLADSHGLYDDRIYWKEAISLKKHGFEVYYLLAGEEASKGTTKEGIHYKILNRDNFPGNRILNFFGKRYLKTGLYNQLFLEAKKLNADVYHIHDLKVNRIGKKLKKLHNNPKVIYDIHEPYPENIRDYRKGGFLLSLFWKWYSKYISRWEKKCVRQYDFIIATEENIRDRFRKILPKEKVDTIYNYTNLSDTRKVISFEDKTYDAIYTGGITKLRGAFKILKAVKIAAAEKKDIKVLFLGSYFPPELKVKMDKFISENGLKKNIDLFDSVPYSEVADYYNKSKVGLGIFLSCETHRIILQIKIFEYMNYGLPIVGSNFGHINNYIKNEDVGIAVNPEDPEEIANAILKILEDQELYDSFSKNGKHAIDEKYNWTFMESKLVKIYESLIDDKSKAEA